MKKKSSSDHIFGRTLFWVLLFWLGMVVLTMLYNLDQQKTLSTLRHSEDEVRLRTNLALSQDHDWAGEEEARLSLMRILSSASYYSGNAMKVTRLYDHETGEELARSQLALAIVQDQAGETTHYVLFDEVLSREEQITLAENITRDQWNGSVYRAIQEPYNGDADHVEVTGIVEGKVIYPQRLVYYYESGAVTAVESENEMFRGKELTTIRTDRFHMDCDLVWVKQHQLSYETGMRLYEKAEAYLDEALKDREPQQSNLTWERRDGRVRVAAGQELEDILASSRVYIPWRMACEGLETAYILSFIDAVIVAAIIAHMERERLRKERELTRAMAHELKTPAAVMRAYAEALKENVAPERREEYLDTIVEESDRLGGMVSELLDLSRMSGAKTAMAFVRVDLKPIVEGCFERLRLPLEERGLELRMDLERAVVNGDPKRLEHMVSNLALNVLHHAQPGPVRVKLNAKGELMVENRCAPMDKETLKRIWEPFYKVNGDGNGLGLAIVHNIVTQHQGGCYTQTTEDGIRFIIRL